VGCGPASREEASPRRGRRLSLRTRTGSVGAMPRANPRDARASSIASVSRTSSGRPAPPCVCGSEGRVRRVGVWKLCGAEAGAGQLRVLARGRAHFGSSLFNELSHGFRPRYINRVAGRDLHNGRTRPGIHRLLGRRGDHPVFGRDEVPAWLAAPRRLADRAAQGSTPHGTCESAMNAGSPGLTEPDTCLRRSGGGASVRTRTSCARRFPWERASPPRRCALSQRTTSESATADAQRFRSHQRERPGCCAPPSRT
jgi:hypothetical protein